MVDDSKTICAAASSAGPVATWLVCRQNNHFGVGSRPARQKGSLGVMRKRGALFYTLDDMKRELTLRIVLERPPKGVDFGLQKGRGSAYETVQKQRSKGSDLVFAFIVEA